jgi:prepilin-type N-terminal cleavage/methylation domain-containing protein
MNICSTSQPARVDEGFTLVEVQIVVAVIALMAAIAVPQVCLITGQARTAKELANAQHLSTVAAAAAAAGVVFTELESAVTELTTTEGAVVRTGTYAGTRYRLTSLSVDEVEGAKQHLRFANGQLTVVP